MVKKMNRKNLKLIGISILILFLISLLVFIFKIYNKNVEIPTEYGISYGNPNANIKIIEYMSFQCKDCYDLHNNIGDTLKQKIEDGEVYYTLKHVDFEKFKYDNEIFTKINNIEDFNTIDYIMKNFPTWSKFTDLNQVNTFFKLNNLYENRINMQNKILNEVKDYKINFIPTFYINDKKFVGVFSEEEFNKIINNLK
ncbi:hypothetical protein CYK73_15220 [Clostridium perfringens]|uniref:Protein-disulfide isomerase n=2 Tax=Clostridium perfringens TaxID=1502 RepID=G5DSC5_CLOPF|nr:thioredoxin domain-containing protein [Clostridium perfringens]AEP94966.1 protein-disulfide isomerase [Clostridium perfringens]AWS27206.1 hypothetical protein CYK96_16480 [Clostridium perfringens]PWW97758.1 hypothetical protein CYK75_15350 [Clostridium perfringens]PWW98055.1 hypothetical protein CYK73_15220 [Clostridium perfringens]PWX29559.1 hypothetical protein CYK92_15030 [Clostridium perfringens]